MNLEYNLYSLSCTWTLLLFSILRRACSLWTNELSLCKQILDTWLLFHAINAPNRQIFFLDDKKKPFPPQTINKTDPLQKYNFTFKAFFLEAQIKVETENQKSNCCFINPAPTVLKRFRTGNMRWDLRCILKPFPSPVRDEWHAVENWLSGHWKDAHEGDEVGAASQCRIGQNPEEGGWIKGNLIVRSKLTVVLALRHIEQNSSTWGGNNE